MNLLDTPEAKKNQRDIHIPMMHFFTFILLCVQIQIQLYSTTENPLQLKVVLPWDCGYNINTQILKETYLQIKKYLNTINDFSIDKAQVDL